VLGIVSGARQSLNRAPSAGSACATLGFFRRLLKRPCFPECHHRASALWTKTFYYFCDLQEVPTFEYRRNLEKSQIAMQFTAPCSGQKVRVRVLNLGAGCWRGLAQIENERRPVIQITTNGKGHSVTPVAIYSQTDCQQLQTAASFCLPTSYVLSFGRKAPN
jgi:hypothetical protein